MMTYERARIEELREIAQRQREAAQRQCREAEIIRETVREQHKIAASMRALLSGEGQHV
ncbi:MAG: hypothetical protein AAGA12_05675 [Pseudomonadota bacterium]